MSDNISIFYDLETTGLDPVCQILNMCFTVVDEDWNPIDDFYVNIPISRLQLPTARAMMVTGILAEEHQERDDLVEESQAMYDLRRWLLKYTDYREKKVPLIGFNSNRFDLGFWRTSMIRNGVSPYFANSLLYRDLLALTQRLCTIDERFLSKIQEGKITDLNPFSLKLDRITKCFDIATETQTHDSFDDVRLTIRYAKFLSEEYGSDIREYNPFEISGYGVGGKIVKKAYPRFYDDEGNYQNRTIETISPTSYMFRLHERGNYSVWVDLEKFERGEGRESIFWFNRQTSSFFFDGIEENDRRLNGLAEKAKEEFSGITVDNYWQPKNCDIEQFIYELKFPDLDELNTVIWSGVTASVLKCYHARTLYRRWWLRQGGLGKNKTSHLRNYAKYRYGGKMRMGDDDERHPTLRMMVDEIVSEGQSASDERTKEVLRSLYRFYKNSDILKALQ